MIGSKKKAYSHLTLEDRDNIEEGLKQGKTFKEIGEQINKDRRTVSREILRHRCRKIPSGFNNSSNLCVNRRVCKEFNCTIEKSCYKEDICIKITSKPYVCNGCEYRLKCRKIKYYYYAKIANNEYKDNLESSRLGINISKADAYEIDKLLTPLIIEKNQSINHIYINNPDIIYFSKPTLYSYIDKGVFTCRNIDLQRKVKYKPRKKTAKQRIRRESAVRTNRTYDDFKNYIEVNPDLSIVEMDTVEGIKGGKVLLTLCFRKYKFMLIYLLDKHTEECVREVFDNLKDNLGEQLFKKLFAIILTDNGHEFLNPVSIEKSVDHERVLVQVFYCDPGASWQKGTVEKNHVFIRYVLPKGKSFDNLSQEHINILANNINSTSRDILNGKTPYDAIKLLIDDDILKNKFKSKKIAANLVNLSLNLFKKEIN